MLKLLFFSSLSFFLLLSLTKKNDLIVKETSSLLWKIEGNGLTKESYLFGTMHLIDEKYFYFPKTLVKTIKKSELICTEINLEEIANQTKMLPLLALKEGTILDFFTPIQKDSVLTWAKNTIFMDEKTFLDIFGKYKPFVLLQTITQLSIVGKTKSYELEIGEIAKENKIKMTGLETVEEQIGFFDNMQKSEQAQLILEALQNGDGIKKEMNQLQAAYRNQNLDSLSLLMNQNSSSIKKHEMNLVVNRNKNWLPKIEKEIQNKTVFIAVGAGHLLGETGLISLLRKKGFQVTAVKI